MYMYVCMCVCMCICIYTYIYINVYVYLKGSILCDPRRKTLQPPPRRRPKSSMDTKPHSLNYKPWPAANPKS